MIVGIFQAIGEILRLGQRGDLGHCERPGRITRKIWGGSPGQSMLIIAFAFVGILAFVGLAVDVGVLQLHRIWLGQALDAAALAAAYESPNIRAACMRAVEYLAANGYETNAEFSYWIIFPSEPDAPGGDPGEYIIDATTEGITSPEDCASPSLAIPAEHEDIHYQVELRAEQRLPVAFMGILGFDTVDVGTLGTAERSVRFDVALVLDRSGSMKFDTCGWYRPEDEYACQNRHAPCVSFFADGFEDYADEEAMGDAGWEISSGGSARLLTSGAYEGDNSVGLRGGAEDGWISRRIDTSGHGTVGLFFWARDENMSSSDRAEVYFRPHDSVGWSKITEISGSSMPSSWTPYAVMLPSSAASNPDLQIMIRADSYLSRMFAVDLIELQDCSEVRGPWVWYYSDYDDGCRPDRPMTCDADAPGTLLPGVSYGSSNPPRAQLMEQPMLDVLEATDSFITILDSRRLPGQPRGDQIGLATFADGAVNLHDLSTDYESVRDTLFNSIRADGWTNLGGGIRVGRSILGDGRSNSAHFMVLLTDGWPNHYDYPYVEPTSFQIFCGSDYPCRRTLEYIEAQTQEARRENITIFAIGLGTTLDTETFDASSAYGPGTESFTGMDLLRRSAENTGGYAYHAPTSEELEQIFDWIAEAIFVRLTK